MTTDASKNRFRSPREHAPKFPPRLFTPHIVRFDERKCRRVNLWSTILLCPRPRREISPRGDVYIKSTIIALLVRLFGGVRRRVAFLTGNSIERESHRFSCKRIGPSDLKLFVDPNFSGLIQVTCSVNLETNHESPELNVYHVENGFKNSENRRERFLFERHTCASYVCRFERC